MIPSKQGNRWALYPSTVRKALERQLRGAEPGTSFSVKLPYPYGRPGAAAGQSVSVELADDGTLTARQLGPMLNHAPSPAVVRDW